MEYRALTIGLTDELFLGVQPLLIAENVRMIPSLTVRDAGRLLTQETFQLLIVDLEYLRSVGQVEWLIGIRRISFIPVIVLSDKPEQDLHSMVRLGVDLCVSGSRSHSVVADLSFAQVRRYTEYNHYHTPLGIAPAPFTSAIPSGRKPMPRTPFLPSRSKTMGSVSNTTLKAPTRPSLVGKPSLPPRS